MTQILIVEDETPLREVYKECLSNEGYSVCVAENGEIALSLAKEIRPDLIISDIKMPILDGNELYKVIQDEGADFAAIPFIFLTANISEQQQLEGVKLGANGYLTKPVSLKFLIATVKSQLAFQSKQTAAFEQKIEKIFSQIEQVSGAHSEDHTSVDEMLNAYRKIIDDALLKKINVDLVKNITFNIRELEDIPFVAGGLSSFLEDKDSFILGINELLINAIEHGVAGLGFDAKTKLLDEGTWLDEVKRRLALPANSDKFVEITAYKTETELKVEICDPGDGFDPTNFLDFAPKRMLLKHGRGIAMANAIGFTSLSFEGKGDKVVVTSPLN